MLRNSDRRHPNGNRSRSRLQGLGPPSFWTLTSNGDGGERERDEAGASFLLCTREGN